MKNIFQVIRLWHKTNSASRSLNLLSDHMLDDIGITRGDVKLSTNLFS